MTRIRFMLSTALAALMLTAAWPALPAAQGIQKLDIMLRTTPNPPKTGMNTVEVVLKDAAGKPVTDADVSALFIMPAMPAMKMPEMKSTVTLKHVKDGTYSGQGQVTMAGKWDVTVSVKRSGKEIASTKIPVTAK